ncbi:MAG: trans-2-enoyl-CoA reductase family protein [Gammaproteobacteria bacterium]|nr:trans-2-enoyl-CoA reductase family protein [Gammaproteobacteria bacterium]
MIIEPKVRGFICTTAHPDGCAQNVRQQIDYVRSQPPISGAKTILNNVLVIGCSTGYGLASRIVAAFGANAATLGVMFEKPASDKRTASTGWYNTAAFEEFATAEKIYAKTINGDAFSNEIKQQVIDIVKHDWANGNTGGIDLIIYSLASPRRTDPMTGETYNSTLKPIGKTYREKTVNVLTGEISEVSIEPATEEDINNTVKVMGGEDWELWIDALLNAKVLNQGCKTVAYSYIGPDLTNAVYRNGTIGKAKEHLEKTAQLLATKLSPIDGQAIISVNKAVVTQAAAAIPVVPLYAAILYRVMKYKNLHEGCIEQMYRLFSDFLYAKNSASYDKNGFIRLDDREMQAEIQAAVATIWPQVTTENINQLTDLVGYRDDFYRLFGFHVKGVDYTADVANIERSIRSIKE